MNYKQFIKFLLIITILLCAQVSAWALGSGAASLPPSSEDVILRWNRILKDRDRNMKRLSRFNHHTQLSAFTIDCRFHDEDDLRW